MSNNLPPSYDEAMSTNSSASKIDQKEENTLPFVQAGPTPPTNYGSIVTDPITASIPNEIYFVRGCPICRIGFLETDFPCIGWACGILFFPVGILFCLLMKQKRCTHCGAEF